MMPRWTNPNRKRDLHIKYSDPKFCKYYDIDVEDFEDLTLKRKAGNYLTDAENDRFGTYLLAICYIVTEGPKFRKKSSVEKQQILEQQIFELLQAIQGFDPTKGKIYSYAYRIAYTSACHYYTNKIDQWKKDKRIIEHCERELEDYYSEYSTHKVVRN